MLLSVCLLMAPADAVAQTPAAPTISGVHPGDEALSVVWAAPASVAGVTAYDLRYIPTSADETVDANWTVVSEIWTSGELRHVLTGLTNGAGIDVQVRVVTSIDGLWSATFAGTPAEPGGARETATILPLDIPLGGVIGAGSDVDYFQVTLGEETDLLLSTTGDLDTVGLLEDGTGQELGSNDDGGFPGGPRNFTLWKKIEAGTYYLKVTSADSGAYEVRAQSVVDTWWSLNAQVVGLGGSAAGVFDAIVDFDWFKFTLSAPTDVVIFTSGAVDDTVGVLMDGNRREIVRNETGLATMRPGNFLIRRQLGAGLYYVRAFSDIRIPAVTGYYWLHVRAVTEPGSALSEARPLALGDLEAGNMDPSADVDYFRLDLAEPTDVFARAMSDRVDIGGELLDSGGLSVQANLHGYDYRPVGKVGFTLSDRLAAGTYYFKVSRSGGAETGTYEISVADEGVLSSEFAGCSSSSGTISDPLYGCQWHLSNTGQLGGTAGEDIGVEEVWVGGNTGFGIGVAVVDGGMDSYHRDLRPNVEIGRNHDYERGDGVLEVHSHGTAVAGIIAARDNSTGGRGVAPRATIWGYNLVGNLTDANVVDAMTRNLEATAVSNNSWGPPQSPSPKTAPASWKAAVDTGVTRGYGGKGILYVWAGGNAAEEGGLSNLAEESNYYASTAVCAVNDFGRRSD